MSLIPLGFWAASGGGGGAPAYDLLETQILSSTATSITFSSIPQDYKHLQIRMASKIERNGDTRILNIRLNGDSGAHYATHNIFGDGTSVVSEVRSTSANQIALRGIAGDEGTSNWGATVIDLLDFSNSSKNSTVRVLTGHAFPTRNQIVLGSGLYMNTAAVTSLEIFADSFFYSVGSRFSLYGIKGE